MTGIVQRARDEGIQQGREQGRVEGERMVLQRQLQHRFGRLSPEIVARLTQASRSDLETWADGVLNAETLDDVFGRSWTTACQGYNPLITIQMVLYGERYEESG